jgi:nitrite reductase/ring-hydroxylating ferredoxin subunit
LNVRIESARRPVGRLSLADVREKKLVRMPHPPFDVLVAWVEGRVLAIEDACNHAGASLAEGWLEGDCVVCPMHAYAFELASGKLVRPKGLAGPQRTFDVEIEGDDVVVYDSFELGFT